jgi:hypothetical protein
MLIAMPLLLILALPISAFAESFTVTTNKDIYTPDEKAIIVGTLPEDAPRGYAVLIKVTGPRGDCAAQNILPAADNSFISRAFRLDGCGFGELTVSAFYADQETNSTFTISNNSQTDAGSKLELRMLKNVILQAQDSINTRVKELIEVGYVLPEQAADKYSEGVSEASLALQAIEFGDAAEAKKYMIFAIRDFREVLKALSDENVARFEQTAEQQAANDDNSGVVGKYRMLREYYYRLEELAQKNQVDRENQFQAAALLLANARQMINEDNFEGAERSLGRVNTLLEAIRAGLFDGEEKITPYANTTSQKDEDSARRLTDAADKFEKNALELLNQTGPDSEAQTKVQEALLLIASARASIKVQDLESARDALSEAHKIIEEARDMIENDEDNNTNTPTSNSGENSSDDSRESSNDDGEDSNSNSGSGEEGDEGNKGSNKGSNDEDDQ